ncbi:MAG: hypothetical protein IJH53_09255 [Oscillospiraceae bacterium]|nr:hypothetical protein [Oscillospiraceae bacterium]
MANFEDFLNDYDLDEPQEEDSLDLPEFDTSAADNSYEADPVPEYNDDADDYSQPDAYYQDVDDGFNDDYEDDYKDDFSEKPSKKGSPKVKLPSFSGFGKGIGSNAILSIVVAISIVLSLIAIISSAGVKKSVNSDIKTLYSQMDSVISTNSQVLEKLARIEDVLDLSAQVAAETNSKYITITKQPTSANTVLGRGSDGLVLVFSVTASGSGLGTGSFNWQKKSGDAWINIDFDSGDNSRNTTYGLQLEVSKETEGANTYTSKVYATGLTEAAFGTYRCVITDSAGERAWSDTVEITKK